MANNKQNSIWQDADTGNWRGNFVSMMYDVNFTLVPRLERKSEREPAYDIFTVSRRHGQSVKVGVAFEKQPKDANKEKFLSISIDDPAMEKPLYLTAFPVEGKAEFEIVWQRPRAKADAA